MFNLELGNRLRTIVDMVPDCDCVCDVGTDHGYVPIWLVGNNVSKRAIATDVNEGPAQIARENIFQFRMEDLIDVRVGDGLGPVNAGECDAAVIAGMGGHLIKDIIFDSLEKCKSMSCLVLQPMSKQEVLRKFLYDNGFDIVSERLAAEEDKFYVIMSVAFTGHNKAVPEINFYVGEALIESQDPLLPAYLNKKINKCNMILNNLKNNSSHISRAESVDVAGDGASSSAFAHQMWLLNGYITILESLR